MSRRAYHAEWRLKNKAHVKAYRQRRAPLVADNRLQSKYGITAAQRDAMLKRQGGKCAGCRKPTRGVVDHCHTTGKVRGILCPACNIALGLTKDDPKTLRRLACYLEK